MKKNSLKYWIFGFTCIFMVVVKPAKAQLYASADFDSKYEMLLSNPGVQIEATEAINKLYNFKFAEADAEFRWLRYRYPNHPMPYFLMGLAEWWKIVPNTDDTRYDDRCIALMDTCITLAEKLYDIRENKIEPSFFLAAAYAFKGRIHSERKHWSRATFAGKNALKYLERCKGQSEISPELLFGDGLFNYFAEWIPDNYPLLKPVLWLFPKGNKQMGIQQLEKVGNNAFYTRTEARYFLLQIYGYENQYAKSYDLAKYSWETYPDNPYFERYYLRSAFVRGNSDEAEKIANSILAKIDAGKTGYEAVSGRNAAYVLAYYANNYHRDLPKAKLYYQKTLDYSTQAKAFTSGYYLASLVGLGRIAEKEKNYDAAREYYKTAVDRGEKKSTQVKEAKDALSNLNKLRREERRKQRN
ncbi:tetratricopeptide repeat protein [Runella salmonicolor]|uniref:Tetratricopeptide repeat protein n=1 Tax=Runella salmonicolor TaxID=2950278 RepID=A0ABT1FU29_9BACT|nr:tetratricopeptide repeat protein [Runella salmonicolor]MCP1384268.1 tetratricopeptide repeat protein [Runella salmonicolor]